MSQYKLSDRERSVLAILIDHYIRTAEPVGSRTIATRYDLGVSSATIRNTLADLEDRGLIKQPHTSAGRIPTDQGYRLYVDKILKSRKLSAADRDKIKRELTIDYGAIEDILEQTSRVLARISSQVGVTVSPKFEEAVLNHIDVVPVSESKVLVILTVRSGIVRTVLLEVDAYISRDELQETVGVLNEKLSGLTLGEVRNTVYERLHDSGSGHPQLLRLFIENRKNMLADADDVGFHADGTTNILVQKEFQDPGKLRDFISLLEERRSLIRLLNTSSGSDNITVTIGDEANLGGFEGCATVSKSYHAGHIRGTVGVIGPSRMQYDKLMSVVDYTARILSEILSK
jgi:heat-inducible transcriptional repressor